MPIQVTQKCGEIQLRVVKIKQRRTLVSREVNKANILYGAIGARSNKQVMRVAVSMDWTPHWTKPILRIVQFIRSKREWIWQQQILMHKHSRRGKFAPNVSGDM